MYVFPPNFAGIIQGRSTWLRIAPFIERLKRFGGLLVRVGFGAALVASVALVWIAIFALLTASSQDNRDRLEAFHNPVVVVAADLGCLNSGRHCT